MKRATTDNFLSFSRGKRYYTPRPTERIVRRNQAYPPQPQISDFLPAQPSVLKPSSPAYTSSPAVLLPVLAPTLYHAEVGAAPRRHSKKLFYVLAAAVVVFGGVTSLIFVVAGRQQPTQAEALQVVPPKSVATPPAEKQPAVALPVRLRISKLNVDAPIEHVGLTSAGEMDSPKDPASAAWFNPGPRPGEVGSAVIDGHFGWVDDVPAIFDSLHKLQKGDTLSVEAENGVSTVFVVRELRTYKPDEDPAEVFRSSDGKAHLNLITCKGAWNKSQKSYSNRLVVFADIVE